MTQTWSAEGYAHHADFVPALGKGVVDLLNPQPGERILDLGCGDGTLTLDIKAAGASVVGADSSPELSDVARARGIDVMLMDGERLTFAEEFDAVFSNAALHWMRNPDAVIEGVARALKPGGRFVAEFGGFGCVAAIRTAIAAVLAARGVAVESPWYFPSADEYRLKLEQHGFTVEHIVLFYRPTPLPTGMAGWLETFVGSMLATLDATERAAALREAEALLRPILCDSRGQWMADYTRLRFAARRHSGVERTERANRLY